METEKESIKPASCSSQQVRETYEEGTFFTVLVKTMGQRFPLLVHRVKRVFGPGWMHRPKRDRQDKRILCEC